jgi:hypothetical protein
MDGLTLVRFKRGQNISSPLQLLGVGEHLQIYKCMQLRDESRVFVPLTTWRDCGSLLTHLYLCDWYMVDGVRPAIDNANGRKEKG